MDSSSIRISVGQSWITVCNGSWHLIFLEAESTALPGGACQGEPPEPFEDGAERVQAILDETEDTE